MAARVRHIACGILFFLGVCALLLLNTRHYDNAVAALGFWIAAILLLLPDVLKSRFLPTVILLFIVGLVIVLTKSLPARLVRQESADRAIERFRARLSQPAGEREFENIPQQGPGHDDQASPSGD